MSRAERLLALLQLLRSHRRAVLGDDLARHLGVSLRTIYRDIAALQAQGADIEGEAGVGYCLRPGFTLPPLMFSEEELEALMLGGRWVARNADTKLAAAANMALARIAANLPSDLRVRFDTVGLITGPSSTHDAEAGIVVALREAIRAGTKLDLVYHDADAVRSHRTVRPFGIAYFNEAHLLLGWCELRNDFRHFRIDRLHAVLCRTERFSPGPAALMQRWRETYGIAEQHYVC